MPKYPRKQKAYLAKQKSMMEAKKKTPPSKENAAICNEGNQLIANDPKVPIIRAGKRLLVCIIIIYFVYIYK